MRSLPFLPILLVFFLEKYNFDGRKQKTPPPEMGGGETMSLFEPDNIIQGICTKLPIVNLINFNQIQSFGQERNGGNLIAKFVIAQCLISHSPVSLALVTV